MVVLAAFAGLLILGAILQDAFEVMLLPRRVFRNIRLARLFFIAAWGIWSRVARRVSDDGRRESVLSYFGPLIMMVLFAVWAGGLILGYGLLFWALHQTPGANGHLPEPLTSQIFLSGVTFFTLGYGDVVPHNAASKAIAVIEAGMGLGFIAVVIGYLPVLYQAFSRREAHVMQLDARAGSPPTATTMLCRHAEAGGLPKLDELLHEWEFWSAELLESHMTYPMLIFYRSQHDNQSWLAAMAAVMDACALIMVGVSDLGPLQARMTFTMLRQVLVELSRSIHVSPERGMIADRLNADEYQQMLRIFGQAGLAWDDDPNAFETLVSLRGTYEPLLDGLAKRLLLTTPPFIAAEASADHWEGGHRGLIASRLVSQLAGTRTGPLPEVRLPFRRLRSGLRSR